MSTETIVTQAQTKTRVPRAEMRLARKLATEGLRIQKANARFNLLTPAQKRVAIARDVLQNLATRKILARSGVYLSASTPVEDEHGNSDYTPHEGEQCMACALGAIFACAVPRIGSEFQQKSRADMHRELWDADIFDLDQLDAIENAFEHGDSKRGGIYQHVEVDEDRMVLIMNNIIANNGTFVY